MERESQRHVSRDARPDHVEAMFAACGLPAVVVDRCPAPNCPVCGPRLEAAA